MQISLRVIHNTMSRYDHIKTCSKNVMLVLMNRLKIEVPSGERLALFVKPERALRKTVDATKITDF